MALPVVKNITDCADFSKTVLPYVPQLLALPNQIADVARNKDPEALKEIYLSTNPLVTAVAFSLFLAPLFLIVSQITGNYSQVDRFWSLLPSVYHAHYAIWARLRGLTPTTVNAVLVLSLIWSARLTFNYWRKGGYSVGSEDYRWPFIRSKVQNRLLLLVFNILFISLAQSVLLLMITAPTYIFLLLSTVPNGELTGIPYLAFSRSIFFFIVIETVADQQQWSFHQAKKLFEQTARIPSEYGSFTLDDLDRGFVVSGLWSLSRHPNFLAEQTIWLTLYVWSCYNTETYVNWSGIGALGYLLLFQGSTWLTEMITASKYPEYQDYQARVGRFVPRLSTKPKGTWSRKKGSDKKTE